MACNLSVTQKKATHLPIRALLLQNERQCHRRLLAGNVQGYDPVTAGRKFGNNELGAVCGLSAGAKDAAQKFRLRNRGGPFGFKKKWSARRCMRASQVRLVIFDRAFNPSKIARDSGNRILF